MDKLTWKNLDITEIKKDYDYFEEKKLLEKKIMMSWSMLVLSRKNSILIRSKHLQNAWKNLPWSMVYDELESYTMIEVC